MRAIALRVLLVAAVAHASMANGARTDCSAHTRSSHTQPRTPTAMASERVQHTSTRRSTALLPILRTIAMRTPNCLLDSTMPREHAHLTMVADRNQFDGRHAEHATHGNAAAIAMLSAMLLCRLVPHANFSRFGSTACPPDGPIWTDGPCNLSHAATRVHNPDGLAPNGGHPRLFRETLPTTI